MLTKNNTLWKLLWDYDPNGLVAVNEDMIIQVVNPAFCTMFQTTLDEAIGKDAGVFLGDMADFKEVWDKNIVIKGKEDLYPDYDLYARKMIFPIKDEGIVACIVVDLTREWKKKHEMLRVKQEAIARVNLVVDKQMQVAQEIAGLLGETTAETKVSLLKLQHMLEEEI